MMKMLKIILLVLVLGVAQTPCNSQWIQSITVLPANPTSNDTLTVLAACSFFAGGCDDHTKSYYIFGNDIYANALHCVGVLTVICNYTDTFTIPPLSPGNYTFHLQVDAGQGPSPCTPGIVPGNTDSISFVVTPATGLSEFINQDEIFVFPNPATGKVQIKGLALMQFPIMVELFSQDGKLSKKIMLKNPDAYFDITELPTAVYQVMVETMNGKKIQIPLVKHK